jgi:hypothetical protein
MGLPRHARWTGPATSSELRRPDVALRLAYSKNGKDMRGVAWADRRRRLIAPLTTRMDGWTAQVHQTWQERPGGWHLPSVARTGAIKGNVARREAAGAEVSDCSEGVRFGTKHPETSQTRNARRSDAGIGQRNEALTVNRPCFDVSRRPPRKSSNQTCDAVVASFAIYRFPASGIHLHGTPRRTCA